MPVALAIIMTAALNFANTILVPSTDVPAGSQPIHGPDFNVQTIKMTAVTSNFV